MLTLTYWLFSFFISQRANKLTRDRKTESIWPVGCGYTANPSFLHPVEILDMHTYIPGIFFTGAGTETVLGHMEFSSLNHQATRISLHLPPFYFKIFFFCHRAYALKAKRERENEK